VARLILLLALLGFGSLPVACNPGASKRDAAPPVINSIGDFSLTERNGTTITKSHLSGKVWVASFVFTRCTESCPQVTGTVARLQKELADEADVRFVTFTVDPERDNPDELKRYAEQYRADAEKWLFLTGSEEKIKELLDESFHVAAIRNPNEKDRRGRSRRQHSRLLRRHATGEVTRPGEGVRSGVREAQVARETIAPLSSRPLRGVHPGGHFISRPPIRCMWRCGTDCPPSSLQLMTNR
jgi:protein SCO1/2